MTDVLITGGLQGIGQLRRVRARVGGVQCHIVNLVTGSAQLVSETIGSAYNFDKVYYSFAYAVLQGFIQGAALAHASDFSIDAYTGIVLKRLPVVMENLRRIGDRIADRNHDGDQASIEVWADA